MPSNTTAAGSSTHPRRRTTSTQSQRSIRSTLATSPAVALLHGNPHAAGHEAHAGHHHHLQVPATRPQLVTYGGCAVDAVPTVEEAGEQGEQELLIPVPTAANSGPASSVAITSWRQSRALIAVLVGFSLFTDMVVYGAVVPILPSLADDLGMDESMLGVLFSSYALGLLVSTPPMAYLSDRFRNRKLPMILGLAGLIATTLVFSAATKYWQLLVARTMQGFSAGAPWTVGLSLLADVYSADELGAVIGPVLACNHMGFLAGPVLGGWLFQYLGYRAPFYFAAGLAALNLLLRLVVDESPYLAPKLVLDEESPLIRSASPASSTDTLVTNGSDSPQLSMTTLIRGPPILVCVFVTIVVGGVFAGLEPTLPLFLHNTFALSPSEIGTTFVSLVVPSMFTSTWAGSLCDRLGELRVMLIGLVALAALALIPGIPGLPLWGVVIALVLFGGAQGFAMTPVIPLMARFVSSQGSTSFASVYGIFNLAYSVAILVGPSLAGAAYAAFTFQWLLFLSSGLIMLAAIVVAVYMRVSK
ncbi:major facilitator superfamily domain-containing protein [Blastocladiella britannica]|nr:major facilitator superfamily domain-containing protein [Blastocladiella britannica]